MTTCKTCLFHVCHCPTTGLRSIMESAPWDCAFYKRENVGEEVEIDGHEREPVIP